MRASDGREAFLEVVPERFGGGATDCIRENRLRDGSMEPNFAGTISGNPCRISGIRFKGRKKLGWALVRTIKKAIEVSILQNGSEEGFPEKIVISVEFDRDESGDVVGGNGRSRKRRERGRGGRRGEEEEGGGRESEEAIG
ncbi:unnamed protein product [Prunus armeniaca]|uniref:Uncharacterized protein n=1 Tax=Prunus armeniaca TaxID=36596 RepID=A0A6J5WTU3_PRUAR|nr:unnamed protein product [Prunus armeniaca]